MNRKKQGVALSLVVLFLSSLPPFFTSFFPLFPPSCFFFLRVSKVLEGISNQHRSAISPTEFVESHYSWGKSTRQCMLDKSKEFICFILVYLFYLFSTLKRTCLEIGAQINISSKNCFISFINNENKQPLF